MSLQPRRAAAVAVGALLVSVLAGCGEDDASSNADPATGTSAATTDAGAEAAAAAATWFAGQLTDDVLVNEQYSTPDYGGTVDAIYALEALGEHEDVAERMTQAVYDNAEEYAAPGKDVWAGNAGKLVALAEDHGADPTDLGGFDALSTLVDRIDESGRTSDKSEYGDFANSLGQAWAVRGLTAADAEQAGVALDFLLLQQCADGYFRQDFSKPTAEDQSCDAAKGTVSVDATALAVILLHELAADDEDLADALDRAVDYLVAAQAEDGSFQGGEQLPANANSTGLAGWALQVAGEDDAAAAAATWVHAHQVPQECDGPLADAGGAIAYDDAALAAAGKNGITAETSYQWRLATAQALPALATTPEDAAPAACPAS